MSLTRSASVFDLPETRARAIVDGRYRRALILSNTICRESSLTSACRLTTRDTVEIETPACCATSARVGARPARFLRRGKTGGTPSWL
jgi:hypothetical protein